MKYHIRYIKKQKQYDFTITFKSLELLDTATNFKFLSYDEKQKGIKDNKHKTYIKAQS